MSVLAVYNLKGGVGKTATAVNLAYLAAHGGAPTLLWDLDPQGAATFYFRVKPTVKGGSRRLLRRKKALDRALRGTDFDLLDLLPADFSYRRFDRDLEARKKPIRRLHRLLKPLRKRYTHLFLDSPAALATLAESTFFAADALIIPVVPTTLSLLTLDQIRAHLKKAKRAPRLLPFFCLVDRRKKLHREVLDAHAGQGDFLESYIPYASIVEQMGLHRAPLFAYAPTTPAADAYRALWEEIRLKVEG